VGFKPAASQPESFSREAERKPKGTMSTHGQHPGRQQLERFLRGEATRDEVRAIVRHLLACCPECSAVMGPIYGLAKRWPKALPAGKRKGSTRLESEAVR
jgi:hypothetical protein